MTERRLPGQTPSGGAYSVVRYLDAEGKPTSTVDASSLVFEEYAPDGTLIAQHECGFVRRGRLRRRYERPNGVVRERS